MVSVNSYIREKDHNRVKIYLDKKGIEYGLIGNIMTLSADPQNIQAALDYIDHRGDDYELEMNLDKQIKKRNKIFNKITNKDGFFKKLLRNITSK